MKEEDLPRLLIISEATLSQTAGGAKQTLYNLFTDYPPEKILHLAPRNDARGFPPSPPFHKRIFSYETERIPAIKNRLGALLNGIRGKINLSALQSAQLDLSAIRAFSPEILLICPIGPEGLILGYKLAEQLKLPYLLYFMDNWMEEKKSRWWRGSVTSLTANLLKNASGWLMISEPLQKILADAYQMKEKPCLIVHNPVDLGGWTVPEWHLPTQEEEITIAYAGSVWPMHYDALETMARAVYLMRKEGRKIKLIIYTPSPFWKQYEKQWQQWQVHYGGHIHYQDLQMHLREANFMLLTASFDPRYRPYSESSVQTKITDYLAAGRPIISIGPSYGAGHYFLRQHECGFVIESPDVSKIKSYFTEIMIKEEEQKAIIRRGIEILEKKFNAEYVRKGLYNYIYKIYNKENA